MRADIKEAWIRRLESGQDEQGFYMLNKGGKKCCLGVLCEVLIDEGLMPTLRRIESPDDAVATSYYTVGNEDKEVPNDSALPQSVIDFVEVLGPSVDIPAMETSLARLNDRNKLPFREIADVIRVWL